MHQELVSFHCHVVCHCGDNLPYVHAFPARGAGVVSACPGLLGLSAPWALRERAVHRLSSCDARALKHVVPSTTAWNFLKQHTGEVTWVSGATVPPRHVQCLENLPSYILSKLGVVSDGRGNLVPVTALAGAEASSLSSGPFSSPSTFHPVHCTSVSPAPSLVTKASSSLLPAL